MSEAESLNPRFITTQFGTYGEAVWTGENTSGWTAACDKVLVLPDQAVDKVGGVWMTDQNVDNQQNAATTGIIVALGPQAFAYDSDRLTKWVGERPLAGWRVAFVKYTGQEHMGDDGKMYRMMQDRAIGLYRKPHDWAAPETETK
jgi:co-chaperonin GroES (HSP10)